VGSRNVGGASREIERERERDMSAKAEEGPTLSLSNTKKQDQDNRASDRNGNSAEAIVSRPLALAGVNPPG
jgi:hypothetical protein